MATVLPVTRKAAWDTLTEMEWQMRYYVAAADRNKKKSFGLRFVLLTLAASEAGLFVVGQSQGWFPWVGGAIALLLIGLAVWDALSDYARNAATLRIVSIMCEGLKKDSEALWREVETNAIEQASIEARLKSINDRWLMVLAWDEPATDQKLNREAADAANDFLKGKYVQEPNQ